MKKILILAFTWGIINAKAQYFEHVYGSTSSEEITSGMNTSQTGQGFLFAGMRTTTTTGANALSLVRTDINGDVLANPYFKRNYSIYFNSSLTPIMRVREAFTTELSSTKFILAGVCYKDATLQKYAVFFAKVDQNGLPIPGPTGGGMNYYDIGTDSYFQARNIRLSPAHDKLYIVGLSTNNQTGVHYSMILKIDVASGSLDWSGVYNISGNDESAYDVIEDPNSGEVVVVGYYYASLFDEDAYILRLDASTGNPVANTMLFTSSNANTIEMFKCITIAQNGDYIISGQTNVSGNMDSWTVRIDPSFNVIWDIVNDYSWSSVDNYAIDVMERINTNGQSEIYVGGQVLSGVFGNADIEVYKLDGLTGACISQFTYGTSLYDYMASIDQNNTGTADGLSIFGLIDINTTQFANHDFVIHKAYYNGITACDYDVADNVSNDGPNVVYNKPHILYNRFNTNRCWLQLIGSFNDLARCYSVSIPAGDNSRSAEITGVSENGNSSDVQFLVDQNNEILTVLSGQPVNILTITDITGKAVINNISEGQNKLDISNLENGIYIVKVEMRNGDQFNHKFIKD